mmetsp:Transcript_99076/g.317813  ORF Transcript_99076/g.317813 Transcript_99076/m.317813 type:complete len:211 (+) Transcript_99076:626-1258(+)
MRMVDQLADGVRTFATHTQIGPIAVHDPAEDLEDQPVARRLLVAHILQTFLHGAIAPELRQPQHIGDHSLAPGSGPRMQRHQREVDTRIEGDDGALRDRSTVILTPAALDEHAQARVRNAARRHAQPVARQAWRRLLGGPLPKSLPSTLSAAAAAHAEQRGGAGAQAVRAPTTGGLAHRRSGAAPAQAGTGAVAPGLAEPGHRIGGKAAA